MGSLNEGDVFRFIAVPDDDLTHLFHIVMDETAPDEQRRGVLRGLIRRAPFMRVVSTETNAEGRYTTRAEPLAGSAI